MKHSNTNNTSTLLLDQQQQQQSSISVFWDLENCTIPQGTTATDAINRIKEKLGGVIAPPDFKIYANKKLISAVISEEEAKYNRVTRVPVMNTGKDSADKVIIAEMWEFAWDHLRRFCDSKCSQEQQYLAPTVVLISSDVDFFHSLGKLKERGFNVVIVHGSSVNESVSNYCNQTVDWYKLVRGIAIERPRKHIDVNQALRKLEKCLEIMVYKSKMMVNERNVRASMKYDGKHNEQAWKLISSQEDFKHLLAQATEQQKSVGSFNPSNASWDSFNVRVLGELYQQLLRNAGMKKNGKFPLGLHLHSYVNDGRIPELCPLAQVLEFVELATRCGWIIKDGNSHSISHGLMQQLPLEVIFARQPEIAPFPIDRPQTPSSPPPPRPLTATTTAATIPANATTAPFIPSPYYPSPVYQTAYNGISNHLVYQHSNSYSPAYHQPQMVGTHQLSVDIDSSKAALQHYFQTILKSLPRYECRKSGKDHIPEFEITVHVPFGGNSFFAYGRSGNKKQAEKLAAQNACEQITKKSDYCFPSNFYQAV